MSWRDHLDRFSQRQLRELAALCSGATFLIALALVLSGPLGFIGGSGQTAAVYSSVGTFDYVVPAGQNAIFVDIWGGGGMGGNTGNFLGSCSGYTIASASYGYPGGGGFTYAKIPVTPGETLKIVVGAANGGGIGGANGGTAGGGYSGIFRGAPSQANALAVAGGGGGSGSYVFVGGPNGTCGYYNYNAYGAEAGGGGGGATGGNGGVGPGTGGTQSAGGTGTIAGGALTGGNASGAYMGGGGAGYWGGGSGTATGVWGGGGGGGSSYCAPTNIVCSMLSPTTPGIAPYYQYSPGGAGNTSVAGAVVIVTGAVSLTASPASIPTGGTSQLNWTTSLIAASSCSIHDDKGNLVGSQGLGTDESGASNLWTLNNIADTDQLLDSPSNNFASLNNIYYSSPGYAKGVIYGGGLAPSGNYGYAAGWQLNSGKWYWESLAGGVNAGYPLFGIWGDPTSGAGGRAFPGYTYDNGISYGSDGLLRIQGFTNLANVASLPTFANDDIIGTAYDADTGKVYFSKNGTWLNSANPAAGTGYVYMVHNGTPGGSSYYGKSQVNFGQGGLVPSGLGQGTLGSMAYYWNMNDDKISGSSVTDIAGGNTGVFEGGTPSSAAGKYDEARVFNGSEDMYTSTIVSDPQTFTLSIWFKTSVASGHKLIGLEDNQTGTNSFRYDRHIYMGTDGKIYFGVHSDDGTDSSNDTINSPAALNNNAWHMAAVTFDGSAFGSKPMQLYIDGALVASGNSSYGSAQNYDGYWRVGGYKLGNCVGCGWPAASDGYFNGTLDDARIYNSVLSATDISNLYTQGPPPSTLTLVAGGGGQFAYAPPTGFKALSTSNLPAPAVAQPNQYFNTIFYAAAGAGNVIINSLNFAPDLAWLKNRTSAANNTFWDRVRGNTLALFTDSTAAQSSLGQLTSLDANGATIGYGAGQVNNSTNLFSGYFFKEGATPGFDIVTWTGDGTALRTIADSLGSKPDLIIAKRTNAVDNWFVGGAALNGRYALLNTGGAASYVNSPFGVDLIPTMTGPTTAGVTMSGSTEYQPAWRAGDKSLGANYWYSYPNVPSVAVPQWLKVDLGTAKTVGAYTVTTYYNEVYYLPLNFTFEGSNDNVAWTVLDTETNITWTGESDARMFTVATPGSYRYYRVNVTKSSTQAVIIAELNLWQSPVPSTANFTVAANATNNLNVAGGTYVAYLFSNRDGYLKAGTYLANGSTDGTFVNTNFKPKFVMVKNLDVTNSFTNWSVTDSVQSGGLNPVLTDIQANSTVGNFTSCGGGSLTCGIDLLTNGFKSRNAQWEWNWTWNYPSNFVYLAVADTPFKSQYTASGYTVPNSLRFDIARNEFLSRTPATTASSSQKQTFSAWVKRGRLAGNEMILNFLSGSFNDQVRFETDDSMSVVFAGGTYWVRTQPYVFRDPSAWVHLVVDVDTTQSAGNTVKLYVNNLQVPLTGTFPPTGYNLTAWNKAGVPAYIGKYGGGAGWQFDGELADIYNVDGLALPPSSFGATDASGAWKPIAYAGTVGNNGSHIDFSNTGFTDFSTASGNISVGPLYQTTSYTMSCISSGENAPIIASTTVMVGSTIPALTLAANPTATSTPTGKSTLTWTSLNVNANSCSVTQLDPSNVVSTLSSIGGGDNTNKQSSAFTQGGAYTFKLACVAPDTTGNNGTLTGAPVTGVAGKFGEAANFAASGDYLAPVSAISLASGTWTIATWFKLPFPATASYHTLTRGSLDHEVLVQNSTGQIGTYDNAGGTAFHGVAGTNIPALAAGWHHVAAVGSGSATTYYIDGVSVGSANFKSSNNIATIGNYSGGGQQFGTVDDFRVYSRALASDEISTLFNGGHVTTGLVAYFPFDTEDLLGTTLYNLAAGATTTSATVTVTATDICTDIAGTQPTTPTGCQVPVPSPGICIPTGYTYNVSQNRCIINPPSAMTLSATRVRSGNPSTLSWTITGSLTGVTCTINGTPALSVPGVSTLTGNKTTPAITAPTNYVLSCGNGVATTTASATVTLVPSVQEI